MCLDYQGIEPLGPMLKERRRRKEQVSEINELFELIEYLVYTRKHSTDAIEIASLSEMIEDMRGEVSCMIADISN